MVNCRAFEERMAVFNGLLREVEDFLQIIIVRPVGHFGLATLILPKLGYSRFYVQQVEPLEPLHSSYI